MQLLILGRCAVVKIHLPAAFSRCRYSVARIRGGSRRSSVMLAFGLSKRLGHADFPGIHFCRPATISSPCPRGSEPGPSPLADEFPFEFRQSAKNRAGPVSKRPACLHRGHTRWLRPDLCENRGCRLGIARKIFSYPAFWRASSCKSGILVNSRNSCVADPHPWTGGFETLISRQVLQTVFMQFCKPSAMTYQES
jgi:hypothetical protein